MFCEIADEYGFVAVWLSFTFMGLLSMGILSTIVFIPLYANPTLETWKYKCNPVFPSPLLVKKEIVQTIKGLVVATMIPAFALVKSSGPNAWTNGYCIQGNPIDWRRTAIETVIIFGFTDFTEYVYHHLGHKYKFLWTIHKHHHGFYNPSPFAVIADEWPDQFVRTLPMLAIPLIWRINIDLLFLCFASLFYGYGVYLHSGYETSYIKTHNPIFNTSYHHYTHHAISVIGKVIYTGFFFKIWDQLFNTEAPANKCACVDCRPANERSKAIFDKTIKPDYSVLLDFTWWMTTSIDGVRE
jgi:Delta7-sterol 5-desaturase